MRLAVISDIHGNYKALEAFFNYLEENPADGIVCLGDMVTDGPYPERVMELVCRMKEKYPCWFIIGNREEYQIKNFYHDQGWKEFSSQSGILYYTARHLSERDIRFFENLPKEQVIAPEGCPELMICHGVPGRLRGNVNLEEGLLERALDTLENRYLLGGHTHHQVWTERKGRFYLNPGSLGLAIDGRGRRAEFAMLTGTQDKWKPELLSIPYDVEDYLRDFAGSGLYEYGRVLAQAVKRTTETGINYFYKTVERAVQISGLSLPNIPEEVWEQAGRELGLQRASS